MNECEEEEEEDNEWVMQLQLTDALFYEFLFIIYFNFTCRQSNSVKIYYNGRKSFPSE
jgi:hypothetical protein